jgi:hypothetical protein
MLERIISQQFFEADGTEADKNGFGASLKCVSLSRYCVKLLEPERPKTGSKTH